MECSGNLKKILVDPVDTVCIFFKLFPQGSLKAQIVKTNITGCKIGKF